MTINVILIVILSLITFPLTHVLLKKGFIMDYNITEEVKKGLSKIFYIPYLNVLIAFIYLIVIIIRFKRLE